MNKRNFICFILILVILLLTACRSGTVATEKTREVMDLKERKVKLPHEVKRVVTTYLPATDMVITLGAQETLVGANDKIKKNKFIKQIYPDIMKVQEVASKQAVNLEAVMSLKPDVVIMFPDKESENICSQLTSQGIPALVIDPENIENMKKSTYLLGDVLGREKQAQKLVDDYDETLNMIEERLKDLPREKRKKVYLGGAYGILSTCSKDFYQHDVIEKAGGIDVASALSGGWNQISAEQLIEWNPDVIVAVQYCPEGMPELIKENPQLQSIHAVKQNELYRFPSNLGPWDFPEPRSILGILWLSKTLYPERFEDIDIIEKTDEFHKIFYEKSFTELGGKIDDRGIVSKEK